MYYLKHSFVCLFKDEIFENQYLWQHNSNSSKKIKVRETFLPFFCSNVVLLCPTVLSCTYAGFPQSWKILEKKWSWKVMENSKNSECHGNLFARKKIMEKSWKSVVQICLIVFLLCCDQCGSRLYSSVSLITTIVLHFAIPIPRMPCGWSRWL